MEKILKKRMKLCWFQADFRAQIVALNKCSAEVTVDTDTLKCGGAE